MDLDKDSIDQQPVFEENIVSGESITVIEKINEVKSIQDSEENGCLSSLNEDGVRNHITDQSYISGTKRARTTYSSQQPSVHVIYGSLTRDSKKKLEELMQQWSQYISSSNESSMDVLEYGEETYFPALHVGSENSHAVSFWVDIQARPEQSNGSVKFESDSAPRYDRGFVMGLTSVETSTPRDGKGIDGLEASRCFNCGSYNHSLKECPKPRDTVAVSNARKQHNKKNPSAGPRCLTRYYQNTPGGKFDDLRPGVLGAETRLGLGIGEQDPPPWLNRMREIGYPPGYLDSEHKDQPSGITIYADERGEDGEMQDKAEPEQTEKKMTVEFPGINAPIPENANERQWAPPFSPSLDPSRNRSGSRSNYLTEVSGESNHHQRMFRDYRDEAPPGVSTPESTYRQRFGVIDSMYSNEYQSPAGYNFQSRASSLGRSLSDRGWRTPPAHEGSTDQSFFSPLQNSPWHPRHGYDRWAPESQRRDYRN